MSQSGVASATFSSLQAARSAKQRLVRSGFARNSIDIERSGDRFEVLISTREENQERAERILDGSPAIDDLRHAGSNAVAAFGENRFLILGLAALAGFAIFGLTRRR